MLKVHIKIYISYITFKMKGSLNLVIVLNLFLADFRLVATNMLHFKHAISLHDYMLQ